MNAADATGVLFHSRIEMARILKELARDEALVSAAIGKGRRTMRCCRNVDLEVRYTVPLAQPDGSFALRAGVRFIGEQ